MANQSELIDLYSKRILSLAASIPHLGHLEAPDGTARKRSPLCGSTVTADVVLDEGGKITEFAQDVKACALGQAAASILGQSVLGRGLDELERLHGEVYAMLKENAPAPKGAFSEFEVLGPARDYKNRHASILLSLEATIDAIRAALSQRS